MEDRVLRFLLKRSGGDCEAAREALQNAWVAALKSYRTFGRKSSYFTWISKIALNKLADYYRDQIRHKSKLIVPAVNSFNEMVNPELSPEEHMALQELRTKVNVCLNMLPGEYRQLLQLRYYERLSLRKISLVLRLPLRSLEGRLYRAKKKLAKIYAKA